MGTKKPLKSQNYSFVVVGLDIMYWLKKWNFSNFLIEQENKSYVASKS